MLKIKLIDEQATLNNFKYLEAKDYTPGRVLSVKFQIQDVETKIRYIAPVEATCTVTFQKSDGTELEKTAETLFEDDRSLWMVELTAVETGEIVGSNFLVDLDLAGDEEDVKTGMAYNALAKITFDGEC